MTPEQIELVIRNTVGSEAQRYMLVAFVLVIVGAWLASYFGSYLQSKGNQRAIREELQGLTMQVSATTKAAEEIKAQIGTSTWVQQQRWDLKRQLYTDLLSALYKLQDEYRYIIDICVTSNTFGAPEFKDTRLRLEKQREERAARVPRLWEEVIRVRGFGELTLAKESVDLLDELHKVWTENNEHMSFLDELEHRFVALRDAHKKIVVSAKQDMEL